MNKKAILLLATLILTASMTTLETTARYRSTMVVSDRARVARPVIHLIPDAGFPDQSNIQPGQTLIYGFTVTNTSAEWGVSEVSQTYWMEILCEQAPENQLEFALFCMIDGVREPITPDARGCFPGFEVMDTVCRTHSYQLEVSLPIDAELPDVEYPVLLDLRLSAWQLD